MEGECRMSRLSNKRLRQQQNRGNHQRRRTTRGNRFISKLKKYKWYETLNSKEGKEVDIPKFKIIIPPRRKNGSLIPKKTRDRVINKVRKRCIETDGNVKVIRISGSLN